MIVSTTTIRTMLNDNNDSNINDDSNRKHNHDANEHTASTTANTILIIPY